MIVFANEKTMSVTWALRQPEQTLAAIAELAGSTETAAVEGLVELIHDPPSARVAVAAIEALASATGAVVLEALVDALDSSHVSVRLAALRDLERRRVHFLEKRLRALLRQDPSWLVRRWALRLLAAHPEPARWWILSAGTDPHWRVRHTLIQILLGWGNTDESRADILARLEATEGGRRVQGICHYLRYRWGDLAAESLPQVSAEDPLHSLPCWSWDNLVLTRNLERMPPQEQEQALKEVALLLRHPEERVQGLVVEMLRKRGDKEHLASVLEHLEDPRTGAAEAVHQLLRSLDQDRKEETARYLLHLPSASSDQLAWAIRQVGELFPVEEEQEVLTRFHDEVGSFPVELRAALAMHAGLAGEWQRARLLEDTSPEVQLEALRAVRGQSGMAVESEALARWLTSEDGLVRAEAVVFAVEQGVTADQIDPLMADPDVRVRVALARVLSARGDELASLARLRKDPHPHVRAAALTQGQASELLARPEQETSWHVLATAARLCRKPLWELEPVPWQPAVAREADVGPLEVRSGEPPHGRPLGPEGLVVAPVGISGHYGLPVEGFVRAREAGVNLMFWEPNYHTMSEFVGRLAARERRGISFIAGTFEADGKRVRRDAERALRRLKIDRIAIFLLFWVQEWDRITPDVMETLEELREKGMVGAFGLSTHNRRLAVEAISTGWNPVMVRHSAAHRKAEREVFPHAVERELGLITFNNTCYGRLLRSEGEGEPITAASCLRYTLAQEGVRACLSAPATVAQLEENLAVLEDLSLDETTREWMMRAGDQVYEEDGVFRRMVRAL